LAKCEGYDEHIEVLMHHQVSTADQIRRIADRLYDVAARYSRTQPSTIPATEQSIGQVEGAAVDFRIVVRSRADTSRLMPEGAPCAFYS
jgi:hypothetical protein